jgi:hypothetical protein
MKPTSTLPPVRWVQESNLLEREIAGIVVLAHPDLDGGDPITVTSPGSVVWGLLREPSTLDELTELIAEGFEVDASIVRPDLEALLTDLESHGMVRRLADADADANANAD